MRPHYITSLAFVALVTVVGIASLGADNTAPVPTAQTALAEVPALTATSSPAAAATTTKPRVAVVLQPTPKAVVAPSAPKTTPLPAPATSSNPFQASRVTDPYPTPPLSFDEINPKARAALVNILCVPRGGGSINPVTASGVIIDPKGIILTNAHVAQYVLLSQSPEVDLACTVRTGAPATPKWHAKVLFISPEWVKVHAKQINQDHPTGSGENDYALLAITDALDGSPLPSSFPYVEPDTRHGIAFLDDSILVASYPAEFVGGLVVQQNLYPASSISSVQKLYTFGTGAIDLYSVGGVIEAQGGSSGGAVVNAWGRLVGIISTASNGNTTADRDLRALSLAYINQQLNKERGLDLESLMENDPLQEAKRFSEDIAPALIRSYIELLSR